jgi:hypothetical protein
MEPPGIAPGVLFFRVVDNETKLLILQIHHRRQIDPFNNGARCSTAAGQCFPN